VALLFIQNARPAEDATESILDEDEVSAEVCITETIDVPSAPRLVSSCRAGRRRKKFENPEIILVANARQSAKSRCKRDEVVGRDKLLAVLCYTNAT
jgi:ribosomal protein L36